LEEEEEEQDRVLVDQPLVNVLSVDIQFHILAEHHVLLWFAPNVV
jgi:hypothetical protein